MKKQLLLIFICIFTTLIITTCSDTKNPEPLPNNTISFTKQFFGLGDLDTLASNEFNGENFSNNWLIADSLTWKSLNFYFYFDTANVKVNKLNKSLQLINDLKDSTYTASMIYSKMKFKKGFFEIRCKIPFGHGHHTGFWLVGGTNSENYDEIDIMEAMNLQKDLSQDFSTNYHLSNKGNNENLLLFPKNPLDQQKFTDEFHTFSLLLTENEIVWYWNNNKIRREENVLHGSPLTIILTGSWTSCCKPDKEHPPTTPGVFEIDYIRTFNLK